ncbi:MAG: hypothetical protein JXB32_19765 [Deltaproteobacteria bacterium]|nr:hypothetical protein [Deltaproteobacteria bacterium]
MKKGLWMVLAVLAALALFGGCYITGRAAVPTVHATVSTPPPPTVVVGGTASVSGTYVAPRPVLVSGVTTITAACDPNAPEVLNGLDDNCNGQIDEGWVGSGNLQITLGWSTPADIDLYVVDPSGTEISYMQTQSPTGGFLDRDARGACTNGEVVENVYWNGQPPAGHYVIRVNYYSNCDAAGPTPITVSISYGGQIVGAYQYTIGDGQTVEIASFDL